MSLLDVKCSRRETAAFFICTGLVFTKHALNTNLIDFIEKKQYNNCFNVHITLYLCSPYK